MKSTLDQIEDWLEKAERAKYRVPELAELCYVSRRQLRRYFELRCGMSPHKWLNQVRIWKSLPLLLETGQVSSVAEQLNFERAATFTDRFCDYFGHSPRVFLASPEKTIEHILSEKPGLLEADECMPMDELSGLANEIIKSISQQST